MPRTCTGSAPSSQESPKLGFFRLEPIQSRSSSGEERLSFDHVEDTEPFLAQSKRPWTSRRKARKAEPPWKKFVTTFRVKPGQLATDDNVPQGSSEMPPPQFGVFGQDCHILPSIASTSFVRLDGIRSGQVDLLMTQFDILI